MSTSADATWEAFKPLAQQLLNSLGRVTALDQDAVTATLQSAFLSTPSMSSLQAYFKSPVQSQATCTFDGIDLTETIEHMGNAAIAAHIADLDLGYGFKAMSHRDLAIKVPEEKFNTIMPCVFADHINDQLNADGLESLRVLKQTPLLVEAYKNLIIDPKFNPFGARGDLHFGMTCLFVYEYFVQGPGFTLSEKTTGSQGVAIMQAWKKSHPLPTGPDEISGPASVVKDLTPSQVTVLAISYLPSATFSPNGKASATIQDYALAMQNANLVPRETPTAVPMPSEDIDMMITTKTIFSGANVSYYYSTSYTLWYQWMVTINDNSTGNFWINGIVAAAGQTETTSKSGIIETNRRMLPDTERTTIYGTDLVNWYHANEEAAFLKSGLSFDNTVVTDDDGPSGSCFVPGTLVETSKGPVAIETLHENDAILTLSGAQRQWGLCSDEVVKSAAPGTLYGFNGRNAFFTSGHPFHTTTGIRAIDPSLARIENPWLDVGTLRVGHQLLRLNPAKTGYDLETITAISAVPSNATSVYGVHLRQGLRSYHANGYLVALNYPEITAAAIGKQLQAIPKQQRLQMLRSFADLKPLFARFGAGTVVDRLAQEVHSLKPLAYGGRQVNPNGILSRDLHRTYSMRHRDQNTALGTVELRSGILHVDGARVPQVDMHGAALAWSRQRPDHSWEHAHCEFVSSGNRASGFLVHTSDESPEGNEASLKNQDVIPFVLNAASTVNPSVFPALADKGATQSEPGSVNLEMISSPVTMQMASAAPGSTTPPYLYDFTYPLFYDPNPTTAGVAPNCVLPCGTLLLPTNANYHSSWPQMQIEEFELVKNAMKESVTKEFPDSSKINVTNFGEIYTCTISYNKDSEEVHTYELETPEMIIGCSDEYQTWKSRPDPSDDTPLPGKNLHFTQQLGMSESFSIERLYKSLQIVVSTSGESLTGCIFPYDPEADGNRGAPLAITSQSSSNLVWHPIPLSEPPPALTSGIDTLQLNVEQSILPISVEAVPPLINDSPSAITAFLAQHQDSATQLTALINLPYNAPAINQDVQTMMVQVMQYHMDSADREMFFGITAKPDGLDPSLGAQLDSEVSKWIQTQYAPAYICQMMTTNDANIGTQYRFTNKEIKRINYWWSGKGPGCLAADPNYKLLDRAVQRWVTRDTYELVKTLWNGGTGSDGAIWSDLLYDKIVSDPRLFAELQNSDAQNGTAQLTKICSMMDALDNGHQKTRDLSSSSLPPLPLPPPPSTGKSAPSSQPATSAPPVAQAVTPTGDASSNPPSMPTGTTTTSKTITITDTNANLLSLKVLASVRAESWSQQFWGISQMTDEMVRVVESQWLSELIQELLLGLLAKDQQLTNEVLKNIMQDIADAEAKDTSWAAQSTELKMQQLFLEFSGSLPNFMDALCMAGSAAKKGAKNIYDYVRGVQRAGVAADAAVENVIPVPDSKAKLSEGGKKALWSVVGIVALYCAANNMSGQWSDSDTASRGLMVTTVVGSCLQLLELGANAWEAFLRMGSGLYSNTSQMMMARSLDTYLGNTMTTKAMILDSSAEGGGSLNPKSFKQKFVDKNTRVVVEMDHLGAAGNVGDGDLQSLIKNSSTVVKWRQGFNFARTVLAWLGYVAAVAVVIFMTWELIQDWSSMSQGQKIFSTIQLVLAAIEGGLGGAIVVLAAGWAVVTIFGASTAAAGFGSAIAFCCTAFAAAGPVLAVLAVIVLVVFFIWQSKQPAPPTPVEQWLNTTGKAWADNVNMPDCPIDVSLSPTSVESSESTQTISLAVTNTGPTAAVIQSLSFQFSTGPEDSALFYNEYTFASASTSGTAGTANMQTTNNSVTMTIRNVASDTSAKNNAMNTTLTFAGPSVQDKVSLEYYNNITFAASDTITVQLSGKIWSAAGQQASIVISLGWNDDSWNNTLFLQRSSAP
ncbi:hypothetical protein FOZG_12135 [Fusarium oxysporum Fo47]|uniref:Uncharacterized protein n=1 Tax=Fusarium oxysporum Fo47 TaxID=660027 RepID=W9JWV1_FUSOX|nr:hypothetical protein FOZG_12135 [Fusarium oxysporum Fo47]